MIRTRPAPFQPDSTLVRTLPEITRGLIAISLALGIGALAGCGSGDGQPAHPGKTTYTRFCFSCHQSGVADAPALGKAEDWVARVDKGREVLIRSVVDGVPPGMPPMGLCTSCSEQEIADAVDYMLEALEPAP